MTLDRPVLEVKITPEQEREASSELWNFDPEFDLASDALARILKALDIQPVFLQSPSKD